jgi:ATP-binding cassette, subfamily B, bacterial
MSTTQSRQPARSTNITALRRLGEYLKPVRGRMIGSGAAIFGSMLCGLTIPLLIQQILDGPVAGGTTDNLYPLILVIALLGTGEAVLFYTRRRLIAGPSTSVEAHLRDDLYHHLQRLPITFHDR